MLLELEYLCKSYQGQPVLQDVSLAVEEGELVSIVGPSGAGKTTLLKLIAGLEEPDAGRIRSQADLRQHPAILVFQDYVLFPTMTVFDNVAFGLRTRKTAKAEISEKVTAMLRYFALVDKARFYPNQLSAGQQQRVALARAMVVSPSILLLDEPFANLDRSLKSGTAEFIRRFQKEYTITTVCVTHDLQEAFMMSDRIGVLLDGVLCQYDTARAVYSRPASSRVAAFLGQVNIIPRPCFRLLAIPAETAGDICTVRAEDLLLERDADGFGIIEDVLFAGHYDICRIRIDGLAVTAYSFDCHFNVQDRVTVKVKQNRQCGEG